MYSVDDLIYLFLYALLISLATFGGGSQALFYQFAVQQKQWISSTDLSAVLAFGYATPGPAVFGIATFIGYRLDGLFGALVGTVGIFLIPFVASIITTRYLGRVLTSPPAVYFIRGVGLAAAGLVAATAFGIMGLGAVEMWQVAVALISLIVTARWKANPLLVLIVGGTAGLLL